MRGPPRQRLPGRHLGRLHVGLVEGLHAEGDAGERGGHLPDHHGAAQPVGVGGGVHRHRGVARRGQGRAARLVVADEEEPVVAVDLGAAEGLAHDRHHAGAVLAQGLGHQLLEPEAEARHLGGQGDGELVPPHRTPAAMAAASWSPGLASGWAPGPQATSASVAPSRSASVSTPARRAGTIPNSDMAEYRPPMSARFSNTSRNDRPRARPASSEPGSVITANGPSPPARHHAHSRWLRVSMVEPDLEAATCRVRSGGHASATRATAAGCVESSTTRRGRPGCGPKVLASTSGNRLEPPMPMSTTWSTSVDEAVAALPQALEVPDLVDDVEPSEPVGDLVVAPEGVVAGPHAGHGVAVGQVGGDGSGTLRERAEVVGQVVGEHRPPSYPVCAMDAAASAAISPMRSMTASSWARPGKATS
jgi:hypothetical protein